MSDTKFEGADYVPARDDERLTDQLGRIWKFMASGSWQTLRQIATATGDPESSVSAQLRHLRKPRWGSHTVERNYIGNGVFAYRLIPNEANVPATAKKLSLVWPW